MAGVSEFFFTMIPNLKYFLFFLWGEGGGGGGGAGARVCEYVNFFLQRIQI